MEEDINSNLRFKKINNSVDKNTVRLQFGIIIIIVAVSNHSFHLFFEFLVHNHS